MLLRLLDADVGHYTVIESSLATKKCIADALFLSGSSASCFTDYTCRSKTNTWVYDYVRNI